MSSASAAIEAMSRLRRRRRSSAVSAISGRSKQTAGPDHQHDQKKRIGDGEREAGIDEIGAERLGDAEQNAGDQTADHIADASHDRNNKRLHRKFNADRGIESKKRADKRSRHGDKSAAAGECES